MPTGNFLKKYDYVFAGAGCAALSLLIRMARSGKFLDKKILVIDKAPKTSNDRTWCFWEKEKGFFEDIVYRKWLVLHFFGSGFSGSLDIASYEYKMIRGIDFYEYCFEEIKKHQNIEVAYGNLQFDQAAILLDGQLLNTAGTVIFNSIYRQPEMKEGFISLQQHFKGWIIETARPSFNIREATLMDFRVHQDHGTTFSYVLPLTETKALIEYTLFSPQVLEQQQYDEELKNYIRTILQITDYKICEKESGVIPMTNTAFRFYENGIYNIGMAGGQTKASSGYTFRFIQKHSEKIMDYLATGRPLPRLTTGNGRFDFYDATLLRLLKENTLKGKDIFSRLFQRNKGSLIFKFLDNETSLAEEIRIISKLPVFPFLKAAIK